MPAVIALLTDFCSSGPTTACSPSCSGRTPPRAFTPSRTRRKARLAGGWEGAVLHVDHFGNLTLVGSSGRLEIAGHRGRADALPGAGQGARVWVRPRGSGVLHFLEG